MSRDDIIRMAREAMNGVTTDERVSMDLTPMFERFAALVAAAEREACAKACEQRAEIEDLNPAEALREVATAIRARSQP